MECGGQETGEVRYALKGQRVMVLVAKVQHQKKFGIKRPGKAVDKHKFTAPGNDSNGRKPELTYVQSS